MLSKTTWRRTAGEYTDIISLQPSKSQERFDVALGVLDSAVFLRMWKPVAGRVDEAHSTVRARLADVIGEGGKDWSLTDHGAPGAIVAGLRSDGIDWLAGMHDRHAMIRFLQTRPYTLLTSEAVQLGYLFHLTGDDHQACETLKPHHRRAEGLWKSKLDDLAHEFGCGD